MSPAQNKSSSDEEAHISHENEYEAPGFYSSPNITSVKSISCEKETKEISRISKAAFYVLVPIFLASLGIVQILIYTHLNSIGVQIPATVSTPSGQDQVSTFDVGLCANTTHIRQLNLTQSKQTAKPCNCSYPESQLFPTNCREVRVRTNESGVFAIYPFLHDIAKPLPVYCDHADGGSWMVIQRRVDSSVSFERNWDWYKNGFGDLRGNYWMGLENLYEITKRGNYELRVEMTDFNNTKMFYATYSHFSIGGEGSNYTLNVTGYNGTAGDQLWYHNGKPFSTLDRDNDQLSVNCASGRKGAWWHGGGSFCYSSNLNGFYQTLKPKSWTGIIWGPHHSLKRVEMKIRN